MKKIKTIAGIFVVKVVKLLLSCITSTKIFPKEVIEWRYVQTTFSQFGEDIAISNALEMLGKKTTAYYVDIGSFHPYLYSNTLKLRFLGWNGINVDPSESSYLEFNKHRRDDINLNCAVSNNDGVEEFFEYSVKATCRLKNGSQDNTLSILGEQKIKTKKVRTHTLSKILEEHLPSDKPFGLLSVDCEGMDLEVLKSNDWTKYNPWIVAVEDHDPNRNSEICSFMEQKCYVLFATMHITKIFINSNANNTEASPRFGKNSETAIVG